MRLESNVNGVLERVKRIPRDIRAAMARTLAPAQREKALPEEPPALMGLSPIGNSMCGLGLLRSSR